ncbi:uncharacterized protein LOC110187944 [Drosophila serrata]|uniref:uncharacterized protein LOC110187944 n=1 Tax=Drosophila serrata TaxID=7274 RepID=UPI000A1D29B4|nr:uncharacterized protein LOC110187944 [Drosophila serrata]
MQKPHHGFWWMVLLLGSLIATVILAFSYWMNLPREVHFWSIISRNYTDSDIKFSIPPVSVPEELKLRQRPPFIYQILH